ncbi:hypothetical protein ACJ7V3_12685 [Halomonas elongata]|uniref:hypothetical protein n=1 Tax=Halomonas elongata TaxID=2746 RepID=UPI0038D4CD7E
MISPLDMLMVLGFFFLWFGVFSLVVWIIMMVNYLDEIDCYFDSSDFPNRGVKGIWPAGSGRVLTYGVFLLFHDSKFVRKKFPNAREKINIGGLPRKIKFMVAFPMYTYVPSMMFVLAAWVVLKIQEWFF